MLMVVKSRLLTKNLDGDANDIIWADDNRSIYFAYDERGIRKVGQVNLNGSIKEIVSGLGGTSLGRPYLSGGFHMSANTIAFTYGKPDRPSNVAIVKNGKPLALTALNDDLLGYKRLGQVNEIIYESSFDGQEIQGLVYYPA